MNYYDDSLDYSPYTSEDDSAGSSPIDFRRPPNDYTRYYRDFGGTIPPAVSPNDFEYLDPNDPDISRLRALGARNSGAGALLDKYYSSMPTHEAYEPGIGRKILGFLAGTLTGSGYKGAQSVLDQPYNEAVQEWKMQGPGAAQRAKNLEADKTDEFNAVKLGLNLRAAAAKARAGQIGSNNRLAATNAGKVVNDQNIDEALNVRKQNLADLEESRASRRRLSSLEAQIKAQELKNLQETGRLQLPAGGSVKTPTLMAARKAASQDVMSEYPELFDETTGGFKPEVDQLTRQKIQRHRDSLANIYMSGKQPMDLSDDGEE